MLLAFRITLGLFVALLWIIFFIYAITNGDDK